jgi:hypothetical protein
MLSQHVRMLQKLRKLFIKQELEHCALAVQYDLSIVTAHSHVMPVTLQGVHPVVQQILTDHHKQHCYWSIHSATRQRATCFFATDCGRQ